jgi:hypothetical protein
MIETRFFFSHLTSDEVGHMQFYGMNAFQDEGFLKQQGHGWVPVDHTLIPLQDGGVLLSVMCTRDLQAGVEALLTDH